MLATRSLRFLASRCRPAPLYTWSVNAQASPMAAHTSTTWYIRPPPMTAGYSKDAKNVLTSSLLIHNRLESTAAPNPATKTDNDEKTQSSSSSPLPSTMSNESPTISTADITTHSSLSNTTSSSKPLNMSLESSSATATPSGSQDKKSSSPPEKSTDSCNISSKSSSSSSTTITDKCSKLPPDSPIQPPNIKLPSRDQVEKYFFTALVYVWDFCYYVFCLTLKLVDSYILKNPTLQLYWKRLIKRLDEQREAIKSKK